MDERPAPQPAARETMQGRANTVALLVILQYGGYSFVMEMTFVRKIICFTRCIVVAVIFVGCSSDLDPIPTYTISYNANDATVGTVSSSRVYSSGESATISSGSIDLAKGAQPFAKCWNTVPDGSGTYYRVGDSLSVTADLTLYAQWCDRLFTAADFTTEDYYVSGADLRQTGTYCVVYTEVAANVPDSIVTNVIAEFDNNIYPKITGVFGTPYDVGIKDKTVLLLLDIKDGYNGTGGYVAGYFDPDMMRDNDEIAYSNEEDMLYLDTNPADSSSVGFKETAAHEFQHLINFSKHGINSTSQQDVWLNEGLSAAAEYIYSGTESQDRVDYYNAGAGAVKYGNNFFVWGGADTWEEQYPDTVLDNYATVYLFFRWLGIQAGTGGTADSSMYTSIIGASSTDYQAVLTAVGAKASSVPHGTWDALLTEWLLANYYHEDTGTKGYNGKIDVTAPIGMVDTPDTRGLFSPGEGMFYAISSSYTPPAGSGANIKYFGLGTLSTSIDASVTGGYSGNDVLLLNANSDNSGLNEYGYVASVASAASSARFAALTTYKRPASWAIDVSAGGSGILDGGAGEALEASREASAPIRGPRTAD